MAYKAATAQWLLDQDAWDLAVVGFCETHPASHYLWPAGADSVETGDPAAFGPLRNVYRALDTAIGALRERLPADAVLMVTSGDGVRPNRCGWHLLPAVLERLGYTSSNRPSAAAADAPPPSPAQAARGRLIAAVKRNVAAVLPWRLRDRIGVWLQMSGIDWSKTRAFTLPTDLEGCIRINLRGREPHGIVEPGAEYAALCEEIRGRLEELVNPATGAPAVRKVWIRDQVFPGPKQEELPDVLVSWNDEASLTALQSPRFGEVAGVNPDVRSGTHSASGFLLAAGPAVPAGIRGRGRLTDVAPTVLALLGSTRDRDLDGRPLDALTQAPTPAGGASAPAESPAPENPPGPPGGAQKARSGR